jgi:Flp pilus assembly protein CpaB
MAQSSRRRGRIFILIAVILILGVLALYFVVVRPQNQAAQNAAPTAAPAEEMASIVVSVQPIPYGTVLTEAVLTTVPYPKKLLVPGVFYTDVKELVGKRAKMDLDAKVPITSSLITDGASGSLAAFKIPEGMVAVSIPMLNSISSVGYTVQPGDHVNVIASMMFVDVDTNWQSELPNVTARVIDAPGTVDKPSIVSFVEGGDETSKQGRAEQDQSIAKPVYLQPSEAQRPRLVSQTILQDVIVLQVGETDLNALAAANQPTPTPGGEQQQAAQTTVPTPKIVTLVVTPQDANTLNYLIYAGAEMNLALRGAGDEQRVKTDSVTLQYTMDTYGITVPAKQPYALQPGKSELTLPTGLEPVVAAPR